MRVEEAGRERGHVAVACGGTGGHTYPGLAVARVLVKQGYRVTLWMAGKDVETQTVEGWQGEVITIPAEGFQFGVSWRSVRTVFRLMRAIFHAWPRLSKDRPMCLLAMGSYSSFGPVSASIFLRIPYVLHEANVVPGRLVSLMASRAAAIAISFEKSRYYIQHPNLVETGMPLRAEMVGGRQDVSVRDRSTFSILVTGGSRGAQRLNEVIPEGLGRVDLRERSLQVVHVAGLQPLEPIKDVYRAAGIEAEVVSFVHDMEVRYAQADVVICRSGASTCAELCAFGKPALLVPYPYAVRDHQMLNARALEDAGAADVIEQEGLTPEWLCSYIERLMMEPDRLVKQATASKKMGRMDAAEEVVALLEAVGFQDEG